MTDTFLPSLEDVRPPCTIAEARARLRRHFGQLYVYDALVDLTRRGVAACMATNRYIARLLGLSASVVATHIRALDRLGLIERAAYPIVRSGRKILLRLAAFRARPAPPAPANDNCPVGYSTSEEPPPQHVTAPPLNDQCTPPSTIEEGADQQALDTQGLASPFPAPPNSIQFNSGVEDNVNVRVRVGEGEGEEDPGPVEADPEALVSEPLPADPPSGGEVPAARDDALPSEEEVDRSSIEIWRHWVRTGHPFAGLGAKALRDRGLPPEPGPEAPAPVPAPEVPPAPVAPAPASAPAPRPAPPPRPDTETILRRLRNPHFLNAVEDAATRLAEALDDFHSLPYHRKICREVREGAIRFAVLVRAFRAAMAARHSGTGDPRKIFAAAMQRARKTDPGSP